MDFHMLMVQIYKWPVSNDYKNPSLFRNVRDTDLRCFCMVSKLRKCSDS